MTTTSAAFTTIRRLLALAALAAAVAGAPAAPLGAQSGAEGRARESRRDASREARRRADIARQLEQAVDRARQRLDELGEQSDNAPEARALREAEEALGRIEPDDPRFAMQLARVQQLAARQAAAAFDDPEFKRQMKEAMRLQQQLMLAQVPRAALPIGYLGLSYSSSARRTVSPDGEVFMLHGEHPEVLSVEPGSPADRAGIRRGDTIVAYNGQDLAKKQVSLTKLLVPNERLRVTVRRDGRTRTVPVVVGTRRQTYVRVWAGPDPIAPVDADRIVVVRPSLPAPRAPRAPRPASPVAPAMPAVPEMPAPPSDAGYAVFPGAQTLAVLGAELTRLDDDMREALRADDGVLVIRVQPGSPAARAGLRGADVILRVGSRRVRSPLELNRELQRIAEDDGDSSCPVEVSRRGRTERVTLRW